MSFNHFTICEVCSVVRKTTTELSSFTKWAAFIKCHASYQLFEELAPSFQACTCNIIYKSPTLRETEKPLRVALPRNSIPRMVEAIARHKNIQQSAFLELWNFPMKKRCSKQEEWRNSIYEMKKGIAQPKADAIPFSYEYSFSSCFSKWYIQFPFRR